MKSIANVLIPDCGWRMALAISIYSSESNQLKQRRAFAKKYLVCPNGCDDVSGLSGGLIMTKEVAEKLPPPKMKACVECTLCGWSKTVPIPPGPGDFWESKEAKELHETYSVCPNGCNDEGHGLSQFYCKIEEE